MRETDEVIERLERDIKNAAITLSPRQARYLVDTYYQMQDQRIRSAAQVRSMESEPHETLSWVTGQSERLENRIRDVLGEYSLSTEAGRWARSVVGIGPVIGAGLVAHIDIRKAPTAGHIWRFAGLDAKVKWMGAEASRARLKEMLDGHELDRTFVYLAADEFGRNRESLYRMATTDFSSGESSPLTLASLSSALARRPWNASLKVIQWKAGESFVKVSGRDDAFYGHCYAERKAQEIARNERGEFAGQAKAVLEAKKYRSDTKARKSYENGKLPDAHIHARAKRYAVKLFLAHYHEVAYRAEYGDEPPAPYPIAILGHAHRIPVPR